MKTPKQYASWLKKIKKEIDYSITDEQSFEVEMLNYELLYKIYQKMNADIDNSIEYATMLNQLTSKHYKFLDNFGLNGNAKLRNKYLKKKVEKLDQDKIAIEQKDELDNFLLS